MLPNLQSVVSYYQDRLILQYRGQPKASQTIAIYVKQAVLDFVTQRLQTAFDVYTATGAQLNIVGKYVGVNRRIGPVNTSNTYGFERYAGGGNKYGWGRYGTSINSGEIWMRYGYSAANTTDLPDGAYRTAILLQIILNSSNNTLYSIQSYLDTFFPGLITVTDNLDMTLTYYVSSAVPLDPTSTLKYFLPKPMGVGINIIITNANYTRVLSDGSTTRVLSDGVTQRITA